MADVTKAVTGNVARDIPNDYTWGWRGPTQYKREQETERIEPRKTRITRNTVRTLESTG
jgi:hypothetical protein